MGNSRMLTLVILKIRGLYYHSQLCATVFLWFAGSWYDTMFAWNKL